MAMTNRERIGKGLDFLRDGLVSHVQGEFQQHIGGYWVEEVESRLNRQFKKNQDGSIQWDTYALLKSMMDNWQSVFKHTLGHFERSLVGEIFGARNNWAHEKKFTSDDTLRHLDSMERLSRAVSAPQQADEIAKLKNELQRSVFDEQARHQRRQAISMGGSPLEGLKPWREVVTPHRDVRSGKYMQAEFAADLAQVQRGEGSPEYQKPIEFFGRTFITEGLKELLVGALERLTGKGGDPVVELQTNFGGGKTHSMLALYHLFGRTQSQKLPGIETVLQQAGVDNAPEARRAVLVGTALSAVQPREKADGTIVKTMWGELAYQLGKKKGFAMLEAADRLSNSPGSEDLIPLLREFSPCLILIDEWVAYARLLVGKRDLPAGDFEAQSTFAQALTEAAKAVPECLVVASIPSSKIEIGGDHGAYALDALKNVFERVARPWRPASADEGFEIVRRRLFEKITEKQDFVTRDAVIAAFSRMYGGSPEEFPTGCAEGEYRRKLEAAYPIHPELFDRLYSEWSVLDKFQRTRGVLRLLAKVVHRLWESQDGGYLIMPSSVPMDDNAVKSELTRYLEDKWEPIISSDVDGHASLPLRLDNEVPSMGRFSAARRVGRTLYVGTAPGAREKNPGIDDRQVRLGCAQPGETPALYGDALRRISDKAKYVHQDGNRYWVSTKANLNRLAEDRAADCLRDPETVMQEIVKRLRQDRDRGEFAGVHICPDGTADIPDEMETRLVVLPPKYSHRRGQPDSEAMKLSRQVLETRGNTPRLNRNTLVFLAADKQRLDDLCDAASQYLAWSSVIEDEESLNLDAFQRRQAQTKVKSANETVNARILETWTHVLVPVQPDHTRDIEWDELRVSGNEPLARWAGSKLRLEELIMPVMGGVRLRMALDRYLWKDKDHVRVGDLEEYFARYIYLPRIQGRKTLIRAVQEGATHSRLEDNFAVASGFDDGTKKYMGLDFATRQPPTIDRNSLVVKPAAALKQRADEERELEEEMKKRAGAEGTDTPDPGETTIDPTTGGGAPGTHPSPPSTHPAPSPPQPTLKTHFFGSVKLDETRIGREAGKIAEEVIQHLSLLPGATTKVTMEIEVTMPNGADETIVRTVTENCTTLKFESHGFEE